MSSLYQQRALFPLAGATAALDDVLTSQMLRAGVVCRSRLYKQSYLLMTVYYLGYYMLCKLKPCWSGERQSFTKQTLLIICGGVAFDGVFCYQYRLCVFLCHSPDSAFPRTKSNKLWYWKKNLHCQFNFVSRASSLLRLAWLLSCLKFRLGRANVKVKC